MAKLKAGRLGREVTDACLQYWGGMGYMSESGTALPHPPPPTCLIRQVSIPWTRSSTRRTAPLGRAALCRMST